MDTETLAAEWIAAKTRETEATAERRRIEDELVKQLEISEQLDGTDNFNSGHYKIKVVGRINRTVDQEKLQEIAVEHGLVDHLSSLFRYRLEVSMTAWKAASKDITGPLSLAITAKPGRPSFTITLED